MHSAELSPFFFHVVEETAPFQVTSITGMFKFDILQTDKERHCQWRGGHRNSNSLHSHYMDTNYYKAAHGCTLWIN